MASSIRVHPTTAPLTGSLDIPADKSITHRALMLAALAQGQSDLHNVLESADCLRTMCILRQCGITIEKTTAASYRVQGCDNWQTPTLALDCGNSGTTMRLATGLLAGKGLQATLTGDDSLSRRPMQRVVTPLKQMGADITLAADEYAPIQLQSNASLQPIDYPLALPSAQVKSAILLAAILTPGDTTIQDPWQTRDHSERMLQYLGYPIVRAGTALRVVGGQPFTGKTIEIVNDLSSASPWLVAASLIPGSDITLANVGCNPTRTGIIKILRQMGADISCQQSHLRSGEPAANMRIRAVSKLQPLRCHARELVSAIDEWPLIFVACSRADGQSVIQGLQELRYKETDRLRAMANALKNIGILVEEADAGIAITGGKYHVGCVDSEADHRIAIALAVAAMVGEAAIEIQQSASVDTSYPEFWQTVQALTPTQVLDPKIA